MIVVDPVILYLLMRTDLTSMNPGKACAQAHHAAMDLASRTFSDRVLYNEWLAQASVYGTVLTLGTDLRTIENTFAIAITCGLTAALVTDPTYPVRDGQVTHTIPLVTCGYVLARKSRADFLAHIPLMY